MNILNQGNRSVYRFAMWAVWVVLAIQITAREGARAQSPFSSAFLTEARTSQSGKAIAVRVADPFARAQDEQAMLRYLNGDSDEQWDSKTTVTDLVRDIAKQVPIQLDHRALDEIGISADLALFKHLHVGRTRSQPLVPDEENPFADARPKLQNVPAATANEREPKSNPWWKKGPQTVATNKLTRAAVIFQALQDTDLVLTTHSGRWVITTVDAAESNLSNRLYDITPLLDRQGDQRLKHRSVNSRTGTFGATAISSEDNLLEVLQATVDPETWEALGGPSTCRSIEIGGRSWLVVSTTVMTHWKIQALLNKMNGS